jgi:hypothetical protein
MDKVNAVSEITKIRRTSFKPGEQIIRQGRKFIVDSVTIDGRGHALVRLKAVHDTRFPFWVCVILTIGMAVCGIFGVYTVLKPLFH